MPRTEIGAETSRPGARTIVSQGWAREMARGGFQGGLAVGASRSSVESAAPSANTDFTPDIGPSASRSAHAAPRFERWDQPAGTRTGAFYAKLALFIRPD